MVSAPIWAAMTPTSGMSGRLEPSHRTGFGHIIIIIGNAGAAPSILHFRRGIGESHLTRAGDLTHLSRRTLHRASHPQNTDSRAVHELHVPVIVLDLFPERVDKRSIVGNARAPC